ncbi:hypothetical protein RZ532_01600 [Nitratireductor aquimarinus]|uniref:hypothetical protein n=1 Tax=Nitratireductor aquimarinus TaxID=889300 RepID=UPI002935A1AF|nr:hypothetical protein [Nitratireductor aquimarinus]MDV2964654.1 hypothetical protein [Nitratireductor aquimarinus]
MVDTNQAMKFTPKTTEEQVRNFLRRRFAYLDDANAHSVAESISHLRQRRRGKPRQSERDEIYEAVSKRAEDATIDDAIAAALSDEELAEIDNLKRNYHRHVNRKHALLDLSRIYNEDDFFDALLAKQFDVAAAIFITSETVTRGKIISFLNQY